jgi:hypothetical protein
MYAKIISLGQTCSSAYQIDLFRLMAAARSRSPAPRRESHLFDWQITPLSAVVASLDADFSGLFERDDLVVRDGVVVHRHLAIQYPHQFPPGDGGVSDATIDAHFAQARARHDHLCRRMSALVRSVEPVLYVVSGAPDAPASRLLDALGLHAGHRFHVAFLLTDDVAFDPPADGRVSRHRIEPARKPADRIWEGDDATWLRGLGGLISR